HQVWVRWDSRCVRIFNQRMEQIQIHTRVEPGRFSPVLGAGGLHAPVISSCRYWISRAGVLGEECGQWAQGAFDLRGAESLRSIMGLCGLIRNHSATASMAPVQRRSKPAPTALKTSGVSSASKASKKSLLSPITIPLSA